MTGLTLALQVHTNVRESVQLNCYCTNLNKFSDAFISSPGASSAQPLAFKSAVMTAVSISGRSTQ